MKGDLEANLAVVESVLKRASSMGLHLVLFAELFLSGYDISSDEMIRCSLTRERDNKVNCENSVDQLLQIAKNSKCGLCVGYSEMGSDGNLYNSAILIDRDGNESFNYRKTHLWDPKITHEKKIFRPGSSLPVVDFKYGPLGETCRIGIIICFDCEFPEPARILACQGAELILIPTALAEGPVDDITPSCVVPTRALENHVFILYSNLIGPCELGDPDENIGQKLAFCGQSGIIGPDGRALARAGKTDTVLLTHSLSKDKFAADIERNDYMNLRRPELYQSLIATSQSQSEEEEKSKSAEGTCLVM